MMSDGRKIERSKQDTFRSECLTCSWAHDGGTSTKPALDHARADGHHTVCTRESLFWYDGHPAGD